MMHFKRSFVIAYIVSDIKLWCHNI